MGTGGFFLGIKLQGRETDHSPSTSAKDKKIWVCSPTPPYAFMVSKNFPMWFTFYEIKGNVRVYANFVVWTTRLCFCPFRSKFIRNLVMYTKYLEVYILYWTSHFVLSSILSTIPICLESNRSCTSLDDSVSSSLSCLWPKFCPVFGVRQTWSLEMKTVWSLLAHVVSLYYRYLRY
jgi:hypothetical protein